MIITEKKQKEELLESISPYNTFYIVGCGSCATKCKTGDEAAVSEFKEFLTSNDKKVIGAKILDSACDMRLVKKELMKDESFLNSEIIIALSCGAGAQAIEGVSQKIVIPALNSGYIGTTERIGMYKKFCSICGDCILIATQGICPRTRCAKGLVNGPCGGFVDGKCETDLNKDCAWVLIYEKLKQNGKLNNFLNKYIEPKKEKF